MSSSVPEPADQTMKGAVPAKRSFASGRYVVQRVLPEGGQKTVYVVHDAALDRDCVLALIRPDLLEADDLERFRREARAMARLDHPNIVAVYEVSEEDGRPFFVCQYITGGDLRSALREAGGPLSVERALTIAEDVCRALAHAHEHGIVHRDVKPANVLLTGEGTARLGDFGLATAGDHSRLTLAGTFVGTAAYMAPEQAMGQPADARSDLYALGCVLYEMLTGRPPFLGDDALAVISQHANTAPVAPSWHNSQVPKPLEALTLHLLAKAPDERPASAKEVTAELRRILERSAVEPPQVQEQARGDLRGLSWGVFVGRRSEMDGLKDALEDALSGKGSLAMLAGEPGIGKTRLAEEFCVYARLRGTQVLSGRGYDGESSLPYTPFVEALRQYTHSRADDELRAELGPGAPEIATLVSEIRRRFPDVGEAPKLDGEAERLRLFESMTQFLHNAATANPVVLFLDDLHWADKPSLLLLQHLAQRTNRDRLLLLGAYRDVELDRTHPLSEVLGTLRGLPNYRRVLLRGLPEDTITDLLTVIDPSEEGEARRQALAAALYQETEGNPFFIREVLAHLIETGKIVHENGRWVGRVTSISELGIPEGVREVVGRRLSRLSDRCNRMLTAASTMTSGFSWEALKAISTDVPEAQLLDLLEEALAAQLIIERKGEGGGAYDFTHALIRQTLYDELSTPRRVLLHRQIAGTLEQLYRANVGPHLAELAHHFYQAAPGGDVEKAIDYARRAGDQAMTRVAWEQATANYERALQAMDLIPTPDERARVDVLLALGGALDMGGADRERWRAVFRQAAELARSAGDHERFARAALGFAELIPTPGVVDAEVMQLLEEALQLLGPAESALRARMLARLGNELSFSQQHERKQQLLADALQMARRVDDPETIAYVLANGFWENIDAALALSLANEQVEAASRSGDKHAELRAHQQLAASMLTLGDRAGFDRTVEEEERLQRELRIASYWTGLQRALQAHMDGRFDEAERLALKAFGELQHDDPENAAQGLGAFIFNLRYHQGRLLELEPTIRANAERYPAVPSWAAALASVCARDAPRRDDARAVFDGLAEQGFGRLAFDPLLTVMLTLLAEVCWILGDAARAPELYKMLLPREGQCVVVGWANTAAGAVSRYLAVLAATMSHWEDAERHFEDAIRTTTQLRDKPWLAQTRAEYAAVLLARGSPDDRERALELLQLALDAAQEMGMKKVVEECEALKAQAEPS
ncbi:MAG: protein kinase [Chloroflexota bacterium]|nr:protein kinase [Chloroflexota bacterium]